MAQRCASSGRSRSVWPEAEITVVMRPGAIADTSLTAPWLTARVAIGSAGTAVDAVEEAHGDGVERDVDLARAQVGRGIATRHRLELHVDALLAEVPFFHGDVDRHARKQAGVAHLHGLQRRRSTGHGRGGG